MRSRKKIIDAEKRPGEAEPSDQKQTKRLRSEGAEGPGFFKADTPWAPAISVSDRLMRVGDSAIDSIEVDAALFAAVLLPADLNRMAEITEYENIALMMQYSVLVSPQLLSF